MIRHRHLPISPLRLWAIIVLLPCLCMASLGIAVSVAEAHTQPPHIVTQCVLHHDGSADQCEVFIISSNPQPSELGEATAQHRYITFACILSSSGNANYCVVTITPVGDQIIAPGVVHNPKYKVVNY